MLKYKGKKDHVHGDDTCLGVLIVNLGTPDAPTIRAIRKFLAEFLWDPRVVEMPRALWWLILHTAVLQFAGHGKKVESYVKIWTEEGSPLLAIGKKAGIRIADGIAGILCRPGKGGPRHALWPAFDSIGLANSAGK